MLHAELQNRERAQQDDRMITIQEMKELKEICCSEADRVEASRTDEFARDDLRGSQSTVYQLTVRIQELQDRINCLNDSRDLARS